MFNLVAETDFTGLLDELQRDVEKDVESKLGEVADFVGKYAVEWLRGYTGQLRPPRREGEPLRPARRGGWADENGFLVSEYRYEVSHARGQVTLTLFNDADFAAELELMEGYFVLSGVTDPGGPIEDALRAALAAIAPEYEIRHG
jgi:hypothetical protein